MPTLVPRPRANLLLYHGAFAAGGCWRVAAATVPTSEPPPAAVEAVLPARAGALTTESLGWRQCRVWRRRRVSDPTIPRQTKTAARTIVAVEPMTGAGAVLGQMTPLESNTA